MVGFKRSEYFAVAAVHLPELELSAALQTVPVVLDQFCVGTQRPIVAVVGVEIVLEKRG